MERDGAWGLMTSGDDVPRGATLPAADAVAIDSLLREAVAHHQAGELVQADALYRQILAAEPEHVDALYLLGVMACQVGQFAIALELADRVIAKRPEVAEAHANRGNALNGLRQYEAALASFDTALRLKPEIAEMHANRGNALHGLQRYQDAVEAFGRAIALKPDFVEAHCNCGNALAALGQYEAAVTRYDGAIRLQPGYVEAHCNRGNALHGLHRYADAVTSFDAAIALRPDFAGVHCSRGNALYELARYDEAVASFDAAIRLKEDFAEAHSNRGNALAALGRYQEAVASFDRALRIAPEFAAAHGSRGNALHGLRKYAEAVASFDRALALRPEFAAAWSDRGNALYGAHAFEAAVESCDRAIELQPDFAEAYSNRGTALYRLQRYDAALKSFDQAIQLKPDYAEAYSNRGNALFELREYPAALASFDVAILKNPEYAEAYSNRGKLLESLRQYAAALESFDRALRLKPDTEYLPGIRLHTKRLLCDWEGEESERRDLDARIERGERVADPFVMLALSGSPMVQKKVAEIFVEDRWPPRPGAAMVRRMKREKIRVGYFSADFRNHAISYAMAELLERHDRSRFEIVGFSFGPDVQDAMTARVSAAMDRFVDVRRLLDREVAARSRELEIDIAVDLMGFTEHCRPGIFAERAAPVQVNYLGYPATMGAAYIDYLIADETLVPESSRQHYSEKIVYLPDSFQANDATAVPADAPCSRSAEGLPEQGFVYCCFNSSHKIGPGTFAVWMRILAQVEGSVLWLLEDDAVAAANLRKQAVRAGIVAERLVFAGRVPLPEHRARQRLADLFLDTLPFNAGATASSALWAGLPVLTLMGETFAGRMGGSLLRAVGLPELVTTTGEAYEALAVELARDPARMRAIRGKLERDRRTAQLFDTPRFTRHLEEAYTAMVARSDAGLRAEHISVERSS